MYVTNLDSRWTQTNFTYGHLRHGTQYDARIANKCVLVVLVFITHCLDLRAQLLQMYDRAALPLCTHLIRSHPYCVRVFWICDETFAQHWQVCLCVTAY